MHILGNSMTGDWLGGYEDMLSVGQSGCSKKCTELTKRVGGGRQVRD